VVDNVLSQAEVDALLSAVDRGEIPSSAVPESVETDRPVIRYNFRKPNRVSKEQIKMLQSIHETFARLYTSSLTTLLRGLVEVEFRGVEQVSYGEFIMALSPPSCLSVFNMEPLKGGAVLDINASILFVVIDRLLGGSGLLPVRVREFTEVEKVLVERIAIRAMVDLRQAWHHVGSFGFRVDHTETNPQFVQLTSPNEVVIAVTFDVKIGEVGGPMTIVFPHMLLEPIMPKLSTHRWFAAAPRIPSAEEGEGLTRNLLRVPVVVRGVLAEIPVTVRDILALKPGDILCSGRPVDTPAVVDLQGIPRFTARAGLVNQRKALQLLSTIERGETAGVSAGAQGRPRVYSK
jgi:flagellar motor switch protein FliM